MNEAGMNESMAFRAPMRSHESGLDDAAAVERAVEIGVCGIGGRLDPAPATLGEATRRTDAVYGERVARRLERFASVSTGVFVWTRDAHAFLWLGRVTGAWRYDAAPEASDVDLVHVRDCTWLAEPVPYDEAPPSVHVTFARGGRNWQRIRPPDAAAISAEIWRRREGETA